MDQFDVNSFLKFGYNLNYKNNDYIFDLSGIDKEKYKDLSENDLIEIGKKKFLESFFKLFDSEDRHVVPLSGGLDSRAILGALLNFTKPENIYTYTFGVPGTLDYEIGNLIARKIGTRHTCFNLNEFMFSQNDLLVSSKNVDGQTVLFHQPPIKELLNKFSDAKIWSGFMGDPLAGSHLVLDASSNIQKIKDTFISKNTFVKSYEFTNFGNKDFYEYIYFPNYDLSKVSIYEQIDFFNRQLKYIAPHVLLKGFNYILPFLETTWFNFILSVDNKYRKNERLYRKIILSLFPDLFRYPTKTKFGARLNSSRLIVLLNKIKNKVKQKSSSIFPFVVDPYINYIDFNDAIRKRVDLNTLIHSNIMDLKKRNIINEIDINEIWERHIKKTSNHADLLLVLASLEIHFKASEMKENLEG